MYCIVLYQFVIFTATSYNHVASVIETTLLNDKFFYHRARIDDISFLNVQTLPKSPTQDGADIILSFFVNLPGGTMPLEILYEIFSSSPDIISQKTSVDSRPSTNPNLTNEQMENLVELSLSSPTNLVNISTVIITIMSMIKVIISGELKKLRYVLFTV